MSPYQWFATFADPYLVEIPLACDVLNTRLKEFTGALGNQYFNRPGPRVVESAEILAELLHPEAVDLSHRGTGWIPFCQ